MQHMYYGQFLSCTLVLTVTLLPTLWGARRRQGRAVARLHRVFRRRFPQTPGRLKGQPQPSTQFSGVARQYLKSRVTIIYIGRLHRRTHGHTARS